MRRALALAAVLLLAAPAHAGAKDALAWYPRAVARTVKNMFTLEDRPAAAMQWGVSAAVALDLLSTAHVSGACSRCPEAGAPWLWGNPPSRKRMVLFGPVVAIGGYATLIQWSREELRGGGAERVIAPAGFAAIAAAQHVIAAHSNWNIVERCARARLRCN